MAKGGIDEAQRKEIEAQLVQMEEFKKQLDNQAKAIESERKLFEEQRYAKKASPTTNECISNDFFLCVFYILQESDRIETKRIGGEREETH